MRRVLSLIALFLTASFGFGQSTFTWTGGGGDTLLGNAANWSPASGPPGSNTVTTNTDVALFGNAGTTIGGDPTSPTGNLYIGSFVTSSGSSGAPVNLTLANNTTLTLNGGYVLGSFPNVVAAAQGRDLSISLPSSSIQDGTPGVTTTIYAAPGRTLTLQANSLDTAGSNTNFEGGGKIVLIGNMNAGGGTVNINAGVFAFKGNVNGVAPNSTVATGALLQGGLANGDFQSIGPANFANQAGIRALVNSSGGSPNQLANGTYTAAGTFRINISQANDAPLAPGTYTPNGTIMVGSFTGFGTSGTTYTKGSNPGIFQVDGNGFTVTDWTLALDSNQLRLSSYTVGPVPEPVSVLALAGFGLAVFRFRRATQTPNPATPSTKVMTIQRV
jgi:hypothetical protein